MCPRASASRVRGSRASPQAKSSSRLAERRVRVSAVPSSSGRYVSRSWSAPPLTWSRRRPVSSVTAASSPAVAQASPGGQQPDQLVVSQPAQPVGPGVRGEASQPGACVQGVQYLSGAKPGAGAEAGVLAGQEARREDLRPGRSRLSRRPPVRLGVVRQHPKQIGVGIGRWTAVRVRRQAVQLFIGRRFIPVERISVVRRLIAR
jgi:hypothetical protein